MDNTKNMEDMDNMENTEIADNSANTEIAGNTENTEIIEGTATGADTTDETENPDLPAIEPPEDCESIIEGILFTMGSSVEPAKIATALGIERDEVVDIISELAEKYESENRGIRITELEGAYQMCTSPEIYEYLIRIAKQPRKYVLTDTIMETLSIVAYRQPVTRSEIEKIRGVNSERAVSRLVEFGLIEEIGRADTPGRPMLFGTTEDFLRTFGVSSLDELPTLSPVQMEEFKAEAEEEATVKLGV